MKFKALDFALRELRQTYGRPRSALGIVIVSLLIGYLGPFGSAETMALFPRLAYWLAIGVCTYGTGIFAASLSRALLSPLKYARPVRIAAMALVASVPTYAVAMAITAAFRGIALPSGLDLLTGWLGSLFIALGVVALHFLFEVPVASSRETDGAEHRPDPAILDRLPAETRGPLVRMSMQDHYVEVETTRGTALILLRMADAIRETEGTRGVQIHRSHWVALDGVERVHRAGGKITIETRSGVRLPVSRTYLPAVREAGLTA